MWALAIPWLKNNWLWVVAGICWLSSLGMTLHYGYKWGASGKAEVVAEFQVYRDKQKLALEQLQILNAKDAVIANQKLRQQEYEREENERRHRKTLLAMREELDRVKLDAAFVELFNESALGGRKGVTPQPEQRRDEAPDGAASQAQANPNQGQGVQANTLYDLGEVVLENNKNHNACVDQVEAWQEFYKNLYNNFAK